MGCLKERGLRYLLSGLFLLTLVFLSFNLVSGLNCTTGLYSTDDFYFWNPNNSILWADRTTEVCCPDNACVSDDGTCYLSTKDTLNFANLLYLKGGLSPRSSDNWAYCYSRGGRDGGEADDASWMDCDIWYSGWCKHPLVCGSNSGVKSGETAIHGEYSLTDINQSKFECCGDDANEYPLNYSAGVVCCDSDSDLVDLNGKCHSASGELTNSKVDTEINALTFINLREEENLTIINYHLSQIFGNSTGYAGLNGEEITLNILSYVTQILPLGSTLCHTGSQSLESESADCYGYSQAFEVLIKKTGIPIRIVNVKNIGYMQGHTLTEVYYNNSWHLFDPTFATFFYTKENFDSTGNVLSFKEVLTNENLIENCFQINTTIYSGNFTSTIEIRKVPEEYKHKPNVSFTLMQFYREALSTSFPNSYLFEGKTVSFPLELNLSSGNLWLGSVDSSFSDLSNLKTGDKYTRYAGNWLLGKLIHSTYVHTAILNTPDKGKFKLTYYFVSGSFENLEITELKGAIVTGISKGPDYYEIEGYVRESGAILLVTNKQPADNSYSNIAVVDAIHAEFFESKEMLAEGDYNYLLTAHY
ncbi:MAG: transglutaminase domain-containing protein [Candidatus Pacearchaeota archaeon]